MIRSALFFICLFTTYLIASAQVVDSTSHASPLSINGFADLYYSYDFNEPKDHNRPGFIYSHNRHNEFALNNALINFKYHKDKVRGAIGFHTGSYVKANYAAEPALFQIIYEASVGYKITGSLWIDAGIFASHIGAESAISIDNFTLTRSLMAENSPYYQSGVKLTWQPSDKLLLSGLVLNGWQNITENNENKAGGTQIQFRPTSKILLNSSVFFGKEKPANDTVSSIRFFHDIYAQFDLTSYLTILAAFDVGIQEKREGKGNNMWYTPNLIVRLSPSEKISLAGRVEYYNDVKGVIINTGSQNGFQTFGYSLNFDYKFTPNIAWRIEPRLFNSKDEIFVKDNKAMNQNSNIMTSLAIKF